MKCQRLRSRLTPKTTLQATVPMALTRQLISPFTTTTLTYIARMEILVLDPFHKSSMDSLGTITMTMLTRWRLRGFSFAMVIYLALGIILQIIPMNLRKINFPPKTTTTTTIIITGTTSMSGKGSNLTVMFLSKTKTSKMNTTTRITTTTGILTSSGTT